MARTALAVAILIPVASLLAATGEPQIYRNQEFGIQVPVPQGSLLCPVLADEHDHGPLFLLGTASANGCDAPQANRSFGVFASFNASLNTSTVSKYVSFACKETYKGKCRPAPGNLEFNGHRSMARRADRAGGWIDIIVVCQAGKPDAGFHPALSVNYEAILRTTADHLEEDLRTFRAFLKTIQLAAAP